MEKVNRIPQGRKKRRAALAAEPGTRVKKPAVKRRSAEVAVPMLVIRELDPVRVCGRRTSVVALFRVEEKAERPSTRTTKRTTAGERQVHLVFNDRHGWYCEHGRSCHAVSAVMKLAACSSARGGNRTHNP